MRILNRDDFMLEPAGTVYTEYAPCYFGHWKIKEETLSYDGRNSDWIYQSLDPDFDDAKDSCEWAETLDKIEAGEKSPPMTFDIAGRDGVFEQDQLYAVLDKDDLQKLIARLVQAGNTGAKP